MGVVHNSHVTCVSTNNSTMAACSDSSSSTASCRPSTSSTSGADDDNIPTDTTARSTALTLVALQPLVGPLLLAQAVLTTTIFLLILRPEALTARLCLCWRNFVRPKKKQKNFALVCSCEFMMRHALHVLCKHNSKFLSIMIWSSSIIRLKSRELWNNIQPKYEHNVRVPTWEALQTFWKCLKLVWLHF